MYLPGPVPRRGSRRAVGEGVVVAEAVDVPGGGGFDAGLLSQEGVAPTSWSIMDEQSRCATFAMVQPQVLAMTSERGSW